MLSLAIADQPETLRACIAVAGDWLAVGLDPRPERLAAFPGDDRARPRSTALVTELVGQGVRRLVLAHGCRPPIRSCSSPSSSAHDADILVAGGATDLTAIRRLRDAGVAGVILGEALLSGELDFPAALEAAA